MALGLRRFSNNGQTPRDQYPFAIDGAIRGGPGTDVLSTARITEHMTGIAAKIIRSTLPSQKIASVDVSVEIKVTVVRHGWRYLEMIPTRYSIPHL